MQPLPSKKEYVITPEGWMKYLPSGVVFMAKRKIIIYAEIKIG